MTCPTYYKNSVFLICVIFSIRFKLKYSYDFYSQHFIVSVLVKTDFFFCIEPVILGPHLMVPCSGIWNFMFYLIHFWVMKILNYGLKEKNYFHLIYRRNPLWSWPCCSLITFYRTHTRWHLCYDVDQITESWCITVHLGPLLRLRVNKYSLNIFYLACIANSLNPGWDIGFFI